MITFIHVHVKTTSLKYRIFLPNEGTTRLCIIYNIYIIQGYEVGNRVTRCPEKFGTVPNHVTIVLKI